MQVQSASKDETLLEHVILLNMSNTARFTGHIVLEISMHKYAVNVDELLLPADSRVEVKRALI